MNNVFSRRMTYVFAVLVLVASSTGGHAQVTTATIYGRIVDPSGAAVPGAGVTVKNELTNEAISATSNARGDFTVTFLSVGRYTVSVQARGFKMYEQTGVILTAGQNASLTFTLQVGEVHQIVTVSGAASLINLVNAQQNVSVGSTQVEQLPLAKGDVTSVLQLGPGLSLGGNSPDVGVAINGLPSTGYLFTVDGTNASPDSELSSISLYQNVNSIKGVAIDALQEVQVAKNIFSAEYGDTLSGNIDFITKSGTNQVHGSAFEFYQAGGLNARVPTSTLPTSLVFHNFGATIGFPIVRDKLFVFGDYEGLRQTSFQDVSGEVPTPQFKAQAIAAVPTYKPMFALAYPENPNRPYAPTDLVGLFETTAPQLLHDNQALGRVDYQLNPANRLMVRFTRQHPHVDDASIPGSAEAWIAGTTSYNASLIHASPTWTSETRIGDTSNSMTRTEGYWNTLSFAVPAITALGFSTHSEYFAKGGNNWSVEQVISHTYGRQTLKFGGIFEHILSDRSGQNLPEFTYSTEADFLNNIPAESSWDFGQAELFLTQYLNGYFLQDNVRATPRLMIGLGLRWDYFSVFQERDNTVFNYGDPFGMGTLRPPNKMYYPDLKNWGPRVSLAYRLDNAGRTALRAGYGIFTMSQNAFGVGLQPIQNPNYPLPRIVGFDTPSQNAQFGVSYPWSAAQAEAERVASTFLTGNAISPYFPSPYSQQWTIGIEQELRSGMVLNVSYVGNHALYLLYNSFPNEPNPITGIEPDPVRQNYRYLSPDDGSHYNGLQVSLKQRYRSVTTDVNYTWSNDIAYSDGDLVLGPGGGQLPFDRQIEKGPASTDASNLFTADCVYQLPFGLIHPASSRITDSVLKGWQMSGIFSAQSGLPFTLNQNNQSLQYQRLDYLGVNPYLANYSHFGGTYLNAAAFAPVPVSPVSGEAVRPGILGRNALRGIGSWNLDLSLAKNTNLTERIQMQLRLDAFSALNDPEWTSFNTNIFSSQFGVITGATDTRTVQLGLHFFF